MTADIDTAATADTAESQARLTPRFLVKAILAAVCIIALWVLSDTVIRDWRVEAISSDISPANPLVLFRWEGFGTLTKATVLIPVIVWLAAVANVFAVTRITLDARGKKALVLLPLLLLSVVFMVSSQFAAMGGPVDSTSDPVVMEWAQERYGVELVGDVGLDESPTIVLDDGTTVVATVIETSAGPSVILTAEERGELPVIVR